ncbi:MAG: hypothetical protein DHS20C03_00390 [Minwuia thermotolerans]|nr:MAG: hypothetical protein DHS20C03_00390 [Minwuia thermotolerans]
MITDFPDLCLHVLGDHLGCTCHRSDKDIDGRGHGFPRSIDCTLTADRIDQTGGLIQSPGHPVQAGQQPGQATADAVPMQPRQGLGMEPIRFRGDSKAFINKIGPFLAERFATPSLHGDLRWPGVNEVWGDTIPWR